VLGTRRFDEVQNRLRLDLSYSLNADTRFGCYGFQRFSVSGGQTVPANDYVPFP
jgi:hypothetical protein